jgi:hypothetical protein
MDIDAKWEVLRQVYTDEAELDRVLDKLRDVALSQSRVRLERYERDLRQFEMRYSMSSSSFQQRFEAGELGDAMDFFEWSGLYELHQDLKTRVQRLEQAA